MNKIEYFIYNLNFIIFFLQSIAYCLLLIAYCLLLILHIMSTSYLRKIMIKKLAKLIADITHYDSGITLKIWKMVAPEKHQLNPHEYFRIISLTPHPGDHCVHTRAFANNHYLQVVFPKIKDFDFDPKSYKVIPIYDKTVKRIETAAFENCTALKIIILPQSLKTFGTKIFTRCLSLQVIVIPKTIRKIPTEFCMDSGIRELIIPKNIRIVKQRAFKNCRYLKKVTFLEGTTLISEEAFAACTNLSKVHLPKTTLQMIEFKAFSECFQLYLINLCRPLKSIAGDCFYRCNFKRITLPDSLKILGERAFGSNNNLASVNIPEGIGIINSKVFHCCAIKQIKLPESLKVIDFKAFASNKFTDIEFPTQLLEISNEAFFKCENLKKIKLPSTIEKIGTDAFGNCSLTSVDLPKDFSETYFDWAFNLKNKQVEATTFFKLLLALI